MLHAKQRPGEVDRQGAVPRLDRGVDDALAGDRAGVVDQDVQSAKRGKGRRYHRFPRLLVGDVLNEELRLAAARTQPRGERFAG
jgi:hypothetical protein